MNRFAAARRVLGCCVLLVASADDTVNKCVDGPIGVGTPDTPSSCAITRDRRRV
jgi:hypothetical protein